MFILLERKFVVLTKPVYTEIVDFAVTLVTDSGQKRIGGWSTYSFKLGKNHLTEEQALAYTEKDVTSWAKVLGVPVVKRLETSRAEGALQQALYIMAQVYKHCDGSEPYCEKTRRFMEAYAPTVTKNADGN